MVNIVFYYETSREVSKFFFPAKTSVFMSLIVKIVNFGFSSDCSWQNNLLNPWKEQSF